MRHIVTLATAATIVLMALPASAQMRPSAPKSGTTVTAATMADTGIRPTNFFGVERAQILPKGSLMWNMAGLNFEHGLMDNLELDASAYWNPGIALAPAVGLSGGLNLGLGGKYLFLNTSAMSVAANGGITFNMAGGTLGTQVNVGVPISWWMGKSALHLHPNLTASGGGSTIATGVGYELELNPKWRMIVSDNVGINMTSGAFTNQLQGGVRVAFSPNLTVDVGVAQGNLNINPFSLGVNGTFLTMGASFGTRSIDELRGFFGI